MRLGSRLDCGHARRGAGRSRLAEPLAVQVTAEKPAELHDVGAEVVLQLLAQLGRQRRSWIRPAIEAAVPDSVGKARRRVLADQRRQQAMGAEVYRWAGKDCSHQPSAQTVTRVAHREV